MQVTLNQEMMKKLEEEEAKLIRVLQNEQSQQEGIISQMSEGAPKHDGLLNQSVHSIGRVSGCAVSNKKRNKGYTTYRSAHKPNAPPNLKISE